MPTDQLGQYLDAAKEAARLAAVVLDHWRQRFTVREKARFDLVTDADLASQKTIHDYLRGRFPGQDFLGEEDPIAHSRPGPDVHPTRIFDPTAGNTDYVR